MPFAAKETGENANYCRWKVKLNFAVVCRNGIGDDSYFLWPGNRIPYTIDASFNTTNMANIKEAIDDYNNVLKGCLQWTERKDEVRRVVARNYNALPLISSFCTALFWARKRATTSEIKGSHKMNLHTSIDSEPKLCTSMLFARYSTGLTIPRAFWDAMKCCLLWT